MKSTLKKLKDVNAQIKDAVSQIAEIEKWDVKVCRPGEKEQQLEKHKHWLHELQESKLKFLGDLEWDIQKEREALCNSISETNEAA